MGSDTSHQSRLLKAPSNLALNTAREGAATTSLGNLFQRPTTLSVKNFFLTSSLNLPSSSLKPLPLVLSLHSLIQMFTLEKATLKELKQLLKQTVHQGPFHVLYFIQGLCSFCLFFLPQTPRSQLFLSRSPGLRQKSIPMPPQSCSSNHHYMGQICSSDPGDRELHRSNAFLEKHRSS